MILLYNFSNNLEEDDFEFEVEIGDVFNAIKKIDSERASELEDEYDYGDSERAEQDILDEFEDFLMEYFEEDARGDYNDVVAYNRDPYSFYGVSRKDFM